MKNSFWIIILLVVVNINAWGQCPVGTTPLIRTVTKTTDDGSEGTLRWALSNVPTTESCLIVNFNIPGSGNHIIELSSTISYQYTYGSIFNAVIDGTTQPGYNAQTKEPIVTIRFLNEDMFFYFGGYYTAPYLELSGLRFLNGNINVGASAGGGNNDQIIHDNVFVSARLYLGNYSATLANIWVRDNIFGAEFINGQIIENSAYGGHLNDTYSLSAQNTNILNNRFYNSGMYLNGWGHNVQNNFFSSTAVVHTSNKYPAFLNNIMINNSRYGSGYSLIPVVNFLQINSSTVSGTTTPLDKIQLYTSSLPHDRPLEYSPPYYYTGQNSDLLCLLGETVADASGNWSIPISTSTLTDCAIAFKDIKYFSASSTYTVGGVSQTFPFHSIANPYYCDPISFTGLSDFVCYTTTPIPLTGSGGGTFTGLGIVGNTFVPSTQGVPGTYQTITYTNNLYAHCTATKKVLVARKPVYADRVLSTSAVTFSDSWPITSDNSASSTALKALNDFQNGTRGVWRAESSFAYEDKRGNIAPSNTEVRTQGVLSDVELFDHSSGTNGECNVNWRKVNTVTHYNMAGSETENRDILGLYSSALFGYDGRLAVAVAANASSSEVCYEGFEEYPITTPSTHVTPSKLDMGNFSFFTNTVQASDFPTRSLEFEIIRAQDNVLTVNCPFAESGKYFSINTPIKIFGAGLVTYNEKIINGSYSIQTITAVAGDASKCLITLNPGSFAVSDVWKGKIALEQNVAALNPDVVLPGNVSVQANNTLIKAHTGKQYLKQTSGQVMFEQTNMTITPGDKLVFSAWIRMDNNDRSTYDITTPQGRWRAGLFFYSHDKTALTNVKIRSAGNIIEGWQKVEGEAVVPANATRLVIGLNSDANPVYWDDIRIFPSDGQMQSYVYRDDYKLSAVLDNNNYASFYYYDEEGGLYLTKKETERGVMTISETFTHTQE